MFGKPAARHRYVGLRLTDEEYDAIYEKARAQNPPETISQFIRTTLGLRFQGIVSDSPAPEEKKTKKTAPETE